MTDEIGRKGGAQNIRGSLFVAIETLSGDAPQFYEFGPFRLEPAERRLLRGSEVLVLTPKAFDTLVLLVRNSGHLLEKEELMRLLWPDTVVEEGSLSNHIFLLRKALGEDPQYIETVPKRGYRFVGALRPQNPPGGHSEIANAVPTGQRLSPALVAAIPASVRRTWRTLATIAAVALALFSIAAVLWVRGRSSPPDRSRWVQLTQLPDSVSQPALSPDGRMLAFIRGYSTFLGPGQV